MKNLIDQFKKNYLSIFSLFLAVIALIHTTTLYERSELNRNIRLASFEILMKLGELQQEVNRMHFSPASSQEAPIAAWGDIALIGDLSKLIPAPVPQQVENLLQVWKTQNSHIRDSEESIDAVTREIDATRTAVITIITHLE